MYVVPGSDRTAGLVVRRLTTAVDCLVGMLSILVATAEDT